MPFTPPNNTTDQPENKLLFEGQMFNSPQKVERQSAEAAWQQYKTDGKIDPVMKAVSPMIDKSLQRHLGSVDAVSRAEAKRLLLDSLDRYDPAKASLGTYVDRQLQPMIRWNSRRNSVVKLPDRKRMEAASVGRASRELEREFGRPPSTAQIAERLGMQQSKVDSILAYDRPVMTGSMEVGISDGEDTLHVEDQAVLDDEASIKAWSKFVYDDLGPIDQKIMAHTLGMNGAEILSNKALADKLHLTPGAVSQRKAKIQSMLDRGDELNPFQ